MIENTEIGNEVIEIARNAMNRQDGKKRGSGGEMLCHGSVTDVSRERHGPKLEAPPGSKTLSCDLLLNPAQFCQICMFRIVSACFFLLIARIKALRMFP